MSYKSYTSTKNHLRNAFLLKLADHNLTSPSSLLDDCSCSCFLKLNHSCCATSTWLNEIYIANYFTSSEPG